MYPKKKNNDNNNNNNKSNKTVYLINVAGYSISSLLSMRGVTSI